MLNDFLGVPCGSGYPCYMVTAPIPNAAMLYESDTIKNK